MQTNMATLTIIQDGIFAGTGRLTCEPGKWAVIDGCPAILGPRDFDHGSWAQQDASDRAYEAIERAIAAGADRVEVDGIRYTWQIEEDPVPEVLGLGGEDWTYENEREWIRYGTVRVRLGKVEYEVGVAIGVPRYLRATAKAAGGDLTPYLSAWYVDASDWSCASASEGPMGVPKWRIEDVLEAIRNAAPRLWREHEPKLKDA